MPEHPFPEDHKPDHVPQDRRHEYAAVERHECQHDQVVETHAERVHQRLGQTSSDAGGLIPEEKAPREELNEEGEGEGDKQGQNVHTGASAGPAFEEDVAIASPVEGHVHHLLHPVVRWRRHAALAPHVHVHFDDGGAISLGHRQK